MSTALYVRTIRGNWPLIVALVICGGVGLGLLAHGRDPVYASEARLLVAFTPQPEQPSPLQSRLMQRRVKMYSGLLATPRLTRPVIEAQGLDTTPERLGERVEASSPLNSNEINITVTGASPTRAAAIATALAAELDKVAKREKPTADLPVSTSVTVVRAATTPDEPRPVRWPLHALAGALAGFAIGLGLAVLRGRSSDKAGSGVPVGR
jgi:capsular polysaccharide biosynthesis protein